jgi:hypothetical protein
VSQRCWSVQIQRMFGRVMAFHAKASPDRLRPRAENQTP